MTESSSGTSGSNKGSNANGGSGLRILCLHDGHSNAGNLKKALTLLGDRLYEKHGIDLVYINSPLLCASATTTSAFSSSGDSERVWFEATTKTTTNAEKENTTPTTSALEQPQQQHYLLGLDASLCLLQQMWASMPFWGILGIGQGAAIGSLLSLLPEVKPKARFGIFIQGQALIPEAERLVDDDGDWSCLHILDSEIQEGTHDKLIQQFGGTVHAISRRGRKHSNNKYYCKKTMNIIGKFIVEQKKKLMMNIGGGSSCTALALQNQLYLVEQEASRLIAQQIAANPPNVLMAVVAPKEVSVGGMKRRAPSEEGGGAPCPPEFLLRRETRQTFEGDDDDDGGKNNKSGAKSSRAHPPEDRGKNNNNSKTSNMHNTHH